MKPHARFFFRSAIAAFSFLLPISAQATAPVLNQGNLIMGFRVTGAPGNGTTYLVNIGSAASFRDAVAPITITNINADLTAQFGGSTWKTRADMLWAVAGAPNINGSYSGDPEDTTYISKSQNTENVPGTGFTIASPTNRGSAASRITNVIGYDFSTPSNISGGFDEGTATGGNPRAILQDESAANAWRRYMAPGGDLGSSGSTDFGSYSNIEALPTKTLSLFRLFDGNPSTYLGYLKIQSNGDVIFTPAVGYNSWALAFAGSQPANGDSNHNGLSNGYEWFTGSSVHPSIAGGSITWPRASGRANATSVKVVTSIDLVNWADAVIGLESQSGPVVYALPTGLPKFFVRLQIIP